MRIERVFNENLNVEDIIKEIVDNNFDKNFNKLLNNFIGQVPTEDTNNTDYTIIEKIDCVAHNNKGGTQ